uniref:Paratofuranose glycosyltransferase n=1 Tax=Yersinia pseudotuberculosis TaxID=633 RepID=D7P8K4_YERPU|nr:paratofuranose glycosyltransferase [Yersinia pseudotuberculosis]
MKSNIIIDNSNSDDVLLTIAIPTYKRFDLLKETLRSVFLLEFNIPIEVIIVDNDPDCSELVLLEMDEFKNECFVYYKNAENYGMFGNWNQCLNLGRGKLITILHDDDLLCENFPYEIEGYLKGVDLNSDIPLVGFGFNILEQRGGKDKVDKNIIYKIIKDIFCFYKKHNKKNKTISISLRDLFWGNIFSGTLGVVMERQKALSISGFNDKLYPVSDYEFWIRWIENYGVIKFVNTQVSYYRIRENESMKPEIISKFIEKNYDLRMRIIKGKSNFIENEKDVFLLKKMDEYSFNIAWNRKDNYNLGWLDTLKFICLKFRCVITRFFNDYKNK